MNQMLKKKQKKKTRFYEGIHGVSKCNTLQCSTFKNVTCHLWNLFFLNYQNLSFFKNSTPPTPFLPGLLNKDYSNFNNELEHETSLI